MLSCEESVFSRVLPGHGWRLVWTWVGKNGTRVKISGNAPRLDCPVELANVSVSLATIFATIIVYLTYVCSKDWKPSNRPLLPLHTCRTLLCIILLLIQSIELCESILTMAPFSTILSILAVTSCWVVHRKTETRNGLMGLAVSGCGFAAIAITRLWRIFRLHRSGLTIEHVRTMTTIGTATFCGILAIADTFALYRMIKKNKRYTLRPNCQRFESYRPHTSPFLSAITFHWIVDLLFQGYRSPLDLQDLGELPEQESTRHHFSKFKTIYETQKARLKGKNPSLWPCFWKHVRLAFTIGGILKLFGDATTLVGPMAISKIIDYVSRPNNSSMEYEYKGFMTISQLLDNGYFLGLMVFFASILQSTLSQSSTHILTTEGIRLRVALQALTYDKALKLCSWNILEDEKLPEKEKGSVEKNKQVVDIGTMTNLMSEDVYNIMGFFWIAHYTWAIPLKIAAIISLLYLKLGVSAIAGAICCILTVTPLQLYLGKRMSENSKAITERSDARLRLINEILQGMRLIKLRAWEKIFERRVGETREQELELLDKDSVYWALITFLTHASSILMTLFTFGIYFWTEERHLDAGSIFASLALFSQLTVPLFIFPVIVPIIINAVISTRRLQEFLALPEIESILVDGDDNHYGENDDCDTKHALYSIINDAKENGLQRAWTFGTLANIEEDDEDLNCHSLLMNDSCTTSSVYSIFDKEFRANDDIVNINGVFTWGTDDNQLFVNNLNIPRGKLILIVGKTGSGKTSLLSAILGEIHKVEGSVNWARGTKIAYVAQRPWLLNSTLKENILFGKTHQPSTYKNVIEACALQPDVDILPAGDLTTIGEKGINLSGGQKQRIAIARAIYSDADTVILDDPLSALDQEVGREVFERGIQNALLKNGKSVIMVTHRLELLSYADQIIAMDSCRIRAVGSKVNIEAQDPVLAAEWRHAVTSILEDHRNTKTAKDRWSLIRLISRIGISVRHHQVNNGSWITDQDAHIASTFIPLRLRRIALSGSRYLAHDLTDFPIPAEEWDVVVKKKIRRHNKAMRTSSLQPLKHPPLVSRQSSTPTILESRHIPIRKRNNTVDGTQNGGVLKQLFSGRIVNFKYDDAPQHRDKNVLRRLMTSRQQSNKSGQTPEWDHNPVKKLFLVEARKTHELERKKKSNSIVSEIVNEEEPTDAVTNAIWWRYLKVGGLIPGLGYLGAAVACQAVRVYTDLWLSEWSNNDRNSTKSDDHVETWVYCKVYMALSIGSVILSFIYSTAGQWAGAKARRRFHEEAVSTLLHVPLSIFERIPIGRILNRFSADISVIDKKMSTATQRLTMFVLLCGSAMLVNIAIFPWFLVAAVPTCIAYYYLQMFYRKGARELQRLDGSSRGPVAAHFSETLGGLQTLRASKEQDRFMDLMIQRLDANVNAFLLLNSSSRWLGIALDYLGSVIVVAATFVALITAEFRPTPMAPVLVGMAINYTFIVPIYLNWVVKFVSEIEMYMGSVARVAAFTNVQRENFEDSPKGRLGLEIPHDWPRKGEIVFENVTLRYNTENHPIVRNLNLRIPPGQKLGICGRTGSGKSTTIMALFRIAEIFQGRILLDGINLTDVPLSVLRSRISAIPQDVIMFSGTIRENLDPLHEHGDDELWSALEIAQIKDVISSYPEKLDFEVREGGENFSTGQLQLLNMARAILRKSSLMVFDEATSALDATTEKTLLQAVSDVLRDKTVITIAHRVVSLLDCDRIVVFDDGEIVEDGTPQDLARRPEGFFSKMLKSSSSFGD